MEWGMIGLSTLTYGFHSRLGTAWFYIYHWTSIEFRVQCGYFSSSVLLRRVASVKHRLCQGTILVLLGRLHVHYITRGRYHSFISRRR